MSLSLTLNRLWWKEWRQLLPLLSMLVVVGIFLHLIFLPAASNLQQVGVLSLLIGLPGLFAVGAGALLVGQEKELRTLYWLESLPVNSNQLIRAKLLISCLGLAATWSISLALWAIFSQATPAPFRLNGLGLDEGGLLTWPLHTLYVLLLGIALAWRLQSSLVGLILLVPLALLPAITASAISMTFEANARLFDLQPNPMVLIACQALACGAALGWGWRNASRALRPAPAASGKALARPSSFPAAVLGPSYSPTSALLWQIAKQNFTILLGCTALLLIGFATLSIAVFQDTIGTWLGLAALIAFCGLSWLGASVFQGDKQLGRIHFLADRGVSPSLTWLTRQAVPATLAVCSCVLGTCLLVALAGGGATDIAVVATALLGMGSLVYITSQWTSQLLTSPIVAAIAAPAISLGAVTYAYVSYVNLGCPIGIILACSLLPLATTYILNRRWMEGRYDRLFWLVHAGTLLAVILLPAIPLGITYASQQPMPPNLASQLNQLATAATTQPGNAPREIVLHTDADELTAESSLDAHPDVRNSSTDELILSNLTQQLGATTGAIRLGNGVLQNLQAELELDRLTLESTSAPDLDPSVLNRYIGWFEICTTLAQRLRLSHRLIDQDMADQLEILLLRQLQSSVASAKLPAPTRNAAVQLLSDRQARMAARQRAIAASWTAFKADRSGSRAYDIGGYSPRRDATGNVRAQIEFQHEAGEMIEALWKLASTTKQSTEPMRIQLAQFWNAPPLYYGIGPNGKYFRADDLDILIQLYPGFTPFNPGTQWNADWERQAELLDQANASEPGQDSLESSSSDAP